MGTLRTLIFSALVLVPHFALAEGFDNPFGMPKFMTLLESFVVGIIYVGTPLLVLAIVWTGFLFVAARGSAEGLQEAKKMAVRVILWGTVFLGLWAITQGILNTLWGLPVGALLLILVVVGGRFIFKK